MRYRSTGPLRFRKAATSFRRLGRRGTATVEAAVCLPLLILISLGAIEVNNYFYLRRTMVLAAYEAGRMVSEDGTRQRDIVATAEQTLEQRGVSGYTVILSPATVENLEDGTEVIVSIQVNKKDNQLVPLEFGGPTMQVNYLTVR